MDRLRKKSLHLAHGIHITMRFFESADEAHEWLDFECGSDEEESAVYQTPDKWGEWKNYRNAWLTGEIELSS